MHRARSVGEAAPCMHIGIQVLRFTVTLCFLSLLLLRVLDVDLLRLAMQRAPCLANAVHSGFSFEVFIWSGCVLGRQPILNDAQIGTAPALGLIGRCC